MRTTYDLIKQLLLDAVKFPDFIRANTVMQDPVVQAEMQTRVNALTQDYNLSMDYSNVINSYGALASNPLARSIEFDPVAAGFITSSFREAVVSTPGKMCARVAPGAQTPADNTRYFCVDTTRGVIQLGELLNTVAVFPGLDTVPTSSPTYKYAAPTAVCVFTVATTEYIAIAMGTPHHIVNIYNLATGTGVATIGSIGVSTPVPANLSNPVALAFNSTTSTLYIACTTGQPAGAVSSTGFVCSVNMTTPATPGPPTLLFGLDTRTDGTLLRNEVSGPKALEYDATAGALWIVNGNDEIGSVNLTTGLLNGYIPAVSASYILSGVADIKVKQTLSQRALYIANSAYGNVVVYDLLTKKVTNTYGFRSTEDNVTSQQLLFFGSAGSVNGIVPDTVTINGNSVDCILVSDAGNKRLQRLDESAYNQDNIVVFGSFTFAVPIEVHGWAIVGDVQTEMLEVDYKVVSTDQWHRLTQDGDIGPVQSLQLRIRARVAPHQPIRSMSIKRLLIMAEQS